MRNLTYSMIAAALCLLLGASTSYAQQPAPHLAGKRVSAPGGGAIYLIDSNGFRRGIPDPTTYDNLFMNWNGVEPYNVSSIAEGSPLSSGALLVRVDNTAAVYLISNGTKQLIPDPGVMNKYYFDWAKVRILAPEQQILINFISEGMTWY